VITFFSIPKPCDGHIGVIQGNAVRSWAALASACGGEVILFGRDAGVAELAAEVQARHLPGVATTTFGTPRVDDLFAQAQRIARHRLLCYVNADIVLMSDLLGAARAVSRGRRQLLMVGQRWDTPVTDPIAFDGDWELRLRTFVAERGRLHKPTGIDYFLFTPSLPGAGLFDPIPPFAVGRTAWDNWLIYRARSRRAPVIDATRDVLAVHQDHDYAHGGGYKAVWKGSEARINFELAGGDAHIFTIWDASHVLEHGRITENRTTSLGGGIWNYRRSARYSV
jgi:hypothetical protein